MVWLMVKRRVKNVDTIYLVFAPEPVYDKLSLSLTYF